MRSVYRVLAWLIAIEVAVQAAVIAFAAMGLSAWIDQGNVLDRATMHGSTTPYAGVYGYIIHGINGEIVIPILVLLFLISAFFAKVPHGVQRAVLVVVLVIIQVALGIFGHDLPALGVLHGLNALLLFAVTAVAGQRAARPKAVPAPEPEREDVSAGSGSRA
ncbi:MAG: hypothetical protein L0H41_01435 [Microlunatus sp.]|nr:hypothetical protein [Microlunatus sp.]MDN5769635.1 hypothetical protein [Microlunatus sp.]MDN5803120.1 hypothetical protein [Microlunatus sp.]